MQNYTDMSSVRRSGEARKLTLNLILHGHAESAAATVEVARKGAYTCCAVSSIDILRVVQAGRCLGHERGPFWAL